MAMRKILLQNIIARLRVESLTMQAINFPHEDIKEKSSAYKR